MRKKILAIIACAICLVLVAGVYVLATQEHRKNYTCYEVSVDVGGETFRAEVKMLDARDAVCGWHDEELYSWSCGIYVNNQLECIQGYGYDKCPPYNETESLLRNSITLIKHKGDKKVFTIEDMSQKEKDLKVIYTLGDGKFYSYSDEKQIVKVIGKYKKGKRKKKSIVEFDEKNKKYKEIVPRHEELYKVFPGLYEWGI